MNRLTLTTARPLGVGRPRVAATVGYGNAKAAYRAYRSAYRLIAAGNAFNYTLVVGGSTVRVAAVKLAALPSGAYRLTVYGVATSVTSGATRTTALRYYASRTFYNYRLPGATRTNKRGYYVKGG